MLIINNNNYKQVDKLIYFNAFEGKVDGKPQKGKALFLNIKTSKLKLCIETTYDIEYLKKLKISEENNISKYIIGISYEDENGWMYLTNKCNCTICKFDEVSYKIQLDGHFEECNEKLDIKYNDTFKF